MAADDWASDSSPSAFGSWPDGRFASVDDDIAALRARGFSEEADLLADHAEFGGHHEDTWPMCQALLAIAALPETEK